jgi:hypothetical protein
MFTNAWKFSYDNKKPLSQSLLVLWEDDHSYFQEYQGLFGEALNINDTNNLFILNTMAGEIKKADILMYINSYECPWHKGFKKLYIPHYVHIVDIDYENEVIICDDPYLNFTKMQLPFKHYLSGCKIIRKFYKISINNKKVDVNNIISHIVEITEICQIKNDIKSFANRLLGAKTKEELFDYMDDVYLCSNVRNLKFIADSRYGLSYLVSIMSSNSNNELTLLEIAQRFELCASLFEKITHFYIKLYYRSSDLQTKLQSIHDKLMEVSEIENDIFILLNQLVVQQ